MADAKPEPDLLRFLKDRYLLLKTQAETDNTTPDPPNEDITTVIALIDELYKTINTKDDISHDEIVKQLNALRTPYNELKLEGSYTRYTEATERLKLIVDGLEEVEAGGEELEPKAGSPASAPASNALVPASNASAPASNALVPASNALVPASQHQDRQQ